MLKKTDQDHVFAVKCDPEGRAGEVLADQKGFFRTLEPGALTSAMSPNSAALFRALMAEAAAHGAALRPDIKVRVGEQEYVFSMFAVSRGEAVFVMAVQRPQHLFKVYEEFMGLINEQGRLLRQAQKEGAAQAQSRRQELNSLEECMRLNNELANLQRQVAKQNRDLSEAYTRIEAISRIDPLSGLANRRYFMDRLKEALSLCRRHSIAVSLAMLDLDHFKAVNDAFGHTAGDEVIRGFSEILRKACRLEDLSARYGGEEFMVLMPGTPLDKAQKSAERIRSLTEKSDLIGNGRRITVSIGLAQASATESPEEFILRADTALYRAKNSGRNRVEKAPG